VICKIIIQNSKENIMNGEIVNIIVNIGCTLLGTILGWFLNVLYENKVKKVKLCYLLQQSANIESNIAPEYRTKYSNSDYCIEVYNVGNTAVILEQISLRHKKELLRIALLLMKIKKYNLLDIIHIN